MTKGIKNEVFWKNPGYRKRAPLEGDASCDVLVVGGGVTGVSLSYFLSRRGKNVILVERGEVAGGATGRAAGLLTPNTELDLRDLVELLGADDASYLWHKLIETLHRIKDIVSRERIDCEFEHEDTIYAELARQDLSVIEEEHKALKDAHLRTKLLFAEEIEQELHTRMFEGGLLSHQGASINPLMFTQNLSVALEGKGVRVFEDTPVISIEGNSARTPAGSIRFESVVFATDVSLGLPAVRSRKTTIAVSERLSAEKLASFGLSEKKMIWDSKKKYDYIKITGDGRALIGYGDTNLEKGDPCALHEPHLEEIVSFARRLFPHDTPKIEYAWSGTYGITESLLPYIDVSGRTAVIAGTGGQLVSVMVSRAVANRLCGRKDRLFDMLK